MEDINNIENMIDKFKTTREGISKEEVTELINIVDVLARVENTFGKLYDMIGKDTNNTLYTEAFAAQEICFRVARGEENRKSMMKVMDTLRFAQNTIEAINYFVEASIESDYTKDIKTAWLNANLIRMGNTDFKEYRK